MTENEKLKIEKRKEMERLFNEQKKLMNKIHAIAKRPKAVRKNTVMKRMAEMIVLSSLIKGLELQKMIVASQPIPRFEDGGVAIVGNSDKKEFILKK